MSSISIIVPVFNQSQLTRTCLSSLLENSRVGRDIQIVDNASSDNTPELLNEFKSQFNKAGWNFNVIRNSENLGFGRACNQGIRATQSEYVVILNNDTWLMPGWDEALLNRLTQLQADMVAPYYDETPLPAQKLDGKIDTLLRRSETFVRKNQGKATSKWVSVLMFFSRKSLEKVGLFDERFFVTYEDTDLRERMDRSQMRYFKVGDCYIWHFSKGTRERENLPNNYEHEGLRLFVEKWGFDPRAKDHTRLARLKKRYERIRKKLGYL